MKNNIKKALKEEFGQNARIDLTLVGIVRYPDYRIVCPQYLATIVYTLDGLVRVDDLLVDNVQTRLGLEAGPVNFDEIFGFEDEELPF